MFAHAKALFAAVTVAFLAGQACAAPAPPSGANRTAPSHIPDIWQQGPLAALTAPYEFTISLNSADMSGLTARMQQIASDGSGKWLSDDELAQYVRPAQQATDGVKAFLNAAGIGADKQNWSKYGDQVTVSSTVGQTALLFAAEFFNFNVLGQTVPRTKSYVIPSVIENFVEDVFPLAQFATYHHLSTPPQPYVEERDESALQERAGPASCNTAGVTPQCLRDLYGTASYAPAGGSSSPDIAVMAYIDQYFSQSDLNAFVSRYRPDIGGAPTIPVVLRNGGKNNMSNPGIEAALDVQTVVGQVGKALKTTFIVEGTSQTAGDIFLLTFNDLVNNFSAATRPKVISISYGSDENQFTKTQVQAMCNAAQKLTALGTTIVVASGDNGIDGQNGDVCPPFTPTYPSGCPYILSVGATQRFGPEVMVDTSLAGFYSGAGSSAVYTTPSFQASQVAAYKPKLAADAGFYNANGRFFPDVSAQGSKYIINQGGAYYTVGGTSASCPTVASILALTNDARRKAGKGSLGWANPALYAAGNTAFTDITAGSSACPSRTSLGFPAAAGWDSSAGLGTPKFAGFLTL